MKSGQKILQTALAWVCALSVTLSLTMGLSTAALGADVDLSDDPKVLFLLSYNYDWESVPLQLDGADQTFDGGARIDYIFMDTKHQNYDGVKIGVRKHILSNIEENGAYDYVIAADDAALHFVKEYREELFPGVPVVFEGINNVAFANEMAEDPLVTGVVEQFPLKETISLALKLQPGATHIVGISDETVSGQGSTEQFLACGADFPQLTFEVLDTSQLTDAQVGDTVAGFGTDTILLFLLMSDTLDGSGYTNHEAVEFISQAANTPVFKADELGVGDGILGGVVVSYRDMAARASEIVMALAAGAEISDFPVETAGASTLLDKAVLDRFGLSTRQLDDSVTLINNPPGFIARYCPVLLITGGVLGVLALVVVIWRVNARRVKRYLRQALDAKNRLEETQVAMEVALDSAEVMYFEYYPEKHLALQFNGRDAFAAPQEMPDYPDSWFALKVTHPEDEETLRRAFAEAEQGAHNLRCETRNFMNGEERWFRYGFTTVYDSEGKRVKIACTATDITQQKKAQRVLEKQRESLASTMNNIATGVFVLRRHGDGFQVLVANPAICQMLGIAENSPLLAQEEYHDEDIHPDDRAGVNAAREVLSQANRTADFEFRIKNRTTGDYIWLSAKARSVGRDEGTVLVYVCYYDITEQKRLQALQTTLEAEQKANEAKSGFLANMSHEMRTPMNAILGMTRLAEDEVTDNPTAAEYIHQIRQSSQYLLGIINDVLEMSRIDSGKVEMNREWITPTEVAGAVLDMVEPMMREKHINFTCEPPLHEKARYEYYVDPQKTRQMLMNLLNNACKFTPEGGHVKLTFRNVALDWSNRTATDQLIVEDDGCGMSPDFLRRAFTPFEQERTPETYSIQGTGLGLAISRQIAREMGGDITVTSTLGHGSAFTITFPYQFRPVDPNQPELPGAAAPEQGQLMGMRVLLAEDHPLNATIATKLLEKRGVMVNHVLDGEEAVKVFAGNPPGTYDVILMDVRMPNMDGLTATRAIRALEREDAKTVPIIAMTANAFEEDRKKSEAAGMNAHLAKPIEPELLYSTLAQYGKKK